MLQSGITIYSYFNNFFSILILIQIFDVCLTVFPKQQAQESKERQQPESQPPHNILDIMNNIDKLSNYRGYNNGSYFNATLNVWNKSIENGNIDDIKILTSLSLIKPTNITYFANLNLNQQHQQYQQHEQYKQHIPRSTTASLTAASARTRIPRTMTTTTTISTLPPTSSLLQKLQLHSNSRTANVGDKGGNVEQKQQIMMRPTTSLSNPPKLKSQKTDAPMLNYIFDSFAPNKHHHHDFRYGPHFEDVAPGNITNITAQDGSTVYLNCKISLLNEKKVLWIHKYTDSNNSKLELLTINSETHSSDSRYTVEFQYPNNWRLKILDVNKNDEGLYECQISTYPARVIQIYLHIKAPEVLILDEHDEPLFDKFYEVDSTLQLMCVVRYVTMSTSVVYWKHNERMLNYDTIRGGISVKTDLMEEGANSTLSVAKVNKTDSGNYTCLIGPTQYFTTNVHVLNGESLAELYHGNSCKTFELLSISYILIILLLSMNYIIY